MKTKRVLFILLACLSNALVAHSEPNYRIDSIAPGFWRIQAIRGTLSTAYLIRGTKEVLVIDVCTGQEGLKEIVQQLSGDLPVKVALTHGHFDHSGGIKFFSQVYLHRDDQPLLPKEESVVFHYIVDGDSFDLGGKKIEVIGIPGHTPGSLAFYNHSERYILTGDGIGSTMVWMQISSLPLTTYLASVKRLEKMKDGFDELYVGHHEQETVKLTPRYITDMRIVTEMVLEGNMVSTPYEMGSRSGRKATFGAATLVYHPDRLRAQ